MYLLLALLSVVSLAQTDYYLSSSTASNTLRAQPGRPLYLNIFVQESAFPDADAVKGMIWKDKGVFFEGEEFFQDRIFSNIEAFRVDGGVEFVGKWWAPPRESKQVLELIIYDDNGPIVVNNQFLLVQRTVWVTCSNGIFCDGIERFVDGACRSYSRTRENACDDNDPCTIDGCTEDDGGRCLWVLDLTDPGCVSRPCGEIRCQTQCGNRVCGDDGCGGVCGQCNDGFVCNGTLGTCIAAAGGTTDGTCANPISLLGVSDTFLGFHSLVGDTSEGLHFDAPSCNTLSDAKELVYTLTVPAGSYTSVGAIFTLAGVSASFDTVLEVAEGTCARSASVGCSDDATPPGGVGSRLELTLKPGTTYYIIIDGYSSANAGSFTLQSYFVGNCQPQCDGNFCGNNGCGDVCYGGCTAGYFCSTNTSRCVINGCIPNCFGRSCGSDGCESTCGDCPAGEYCDFSVGLDGEILELGSCLVPDTVCDSLNPVCGVDCGRYSFCSTDCTCVSLTQDMPDLTALITDVVLSYDTILGTSCSFVEGCASTSTTGSRKLLRFGVRSINNGWADLTVPQASEYPQWYQYSPCNDHWFFQGYARYVLYDVNDHILLDAGKESYCLKDSGPTYDAPYVGCSPHYDCSTQGIQRGWTDEDANSLDCQYLDITDIPDGVYKLEVFVNNDRRIVEYTTENNYDSALVQIAGDVVTVVGHDWSGASSGAYCLMMLLAFCFSLLF